MTLSPLSQIPLPDALLSLDDPAALSALESAEERLSALRLQRALLLIASVFDRCPSVSAIGFEISEGGPGGQLLSVAALCNRSERHRFHFFDSYVSRRVTQDPGAGDSDEDQLAQRLLDEACAALLRLGHRGFHRAVFARSGPEPARSAILRRGLSADGFAAWEALFLQAASGSRPAARPKSL